MEMPPPPQRWQEELGAAEPGRTAAALQLVVSRQRQRCLGRGWGEWALMGACCAMVGGGVSAGILLGRLYFDSGGKLRWLYTALESMGWPLLLPPLLASYYRHWSSAAYDAKTTSPGPAPPPPLMIMIIPAFLRHLPATRSAAGSPFTPSLLAAFLALGALTALDNFLFAWGLSYLPVSTAALLTASQLAFNALFSFFLVRHRLTAPTLNAVFAITLAALMLGLHAGGDRPASTSHAQYALGFAAALAAAALYGLILPLTELVYRRIIRKSSFCVILEAQAAIASLATVFALLGMAASGEFAAVRHEAATRFRFGPSLYVLILLGTAAGWQIFFLGSLGLVFLASSLLACLLNTAMLPFLSILAVFVFHDSFSSLKAIALVLSVWGLFSYVYGSYREASAATSERSPADSAGSV